MSTIIYNKKWTIVKFFLDNPTKEVHLRGLSRKLNVSTTWISKIIKDLKKEKLLVVSKDKDKKLVLIKADKESQNYKWLKKSQNLYHIHVSGLLDKIIEASNKPECIVLFGSYAKGEDIEESDLDLAIINGNDSKQNLNKFEKVLNRNIKIINLNKKKIEPEFMNTLANGIILYGYLDVRT